MFKMKTKLILIVLIVLAVALTGIRSVAAQAGTPKPDLVVTSIDGPTSITLGQFGATTAQYKITVRNDGLASAGRFNVGVLVAPSPSLLDLGSVAGLAPGQEADFFADLTFMLTAPGQHRLTATADTNNTVDEANEDNNSKSLDVVVGRTSANTPDPKIGKGKWIVESTTSALTDLKTVIVSLNAESRVYGHILDSVPVLALRCQNNIIDAYISVGMQLDVDRDGNAAVLLRFDKEELQTGTMSTSTSGDAVFFPRTYVTSWIRAMMQHDTMAVGFTPFESAQVETTFDLRGLSAAIEPLQEACGWPNS